METTFREENGVVYVTGPTGTASFSVEFEETLNRAWVSGTWNPFLGWTPPA